MVVVALGAVGCVVPLSAQGPEPVTTAEPGPMEVTSATIATFKGCKDLGSSTVTASMKMTDSSRRHARTVLSKRAASRGATHVVFADGGASKDSDQEQKAQFYQCPVQETPAPAAAPADSDVSGTCFFVNDSGLAVTNRHVVDNSLSIQVVLNDGSTHEAMLVRQQANIDLALLQLRGSVKTSFLVPSDAPGALGEQVFTIGFPFGEALGTDPKFVEGTIASTRVADDDRILQTSMIVHPGNSGGALVRLDGSLAGVVFAKANQMTFLKYTGSLAEGISFAVKAPLVQRLLGADAPKVAFQPRGRSEAIDNAVRATCRVISKHDGRDYSR